LDKIIKIGTRDSRLALWQAETVQQLLNRQGIRATLVPVKSEGDLDLVTPLYAMGVEGVFTKTLDAYLLSGKIDIAVHSMKDVPTQLAMGIAQAAVLKRASVQDIFIPHPDNKKEKNLIANVNSSKETVFHIATGSVRRKAQWLHHFPNTSFENLRGNVQTRLRKLAESNWDGIIMAKAGLERMNLLPQTFETIDWMLPAPAQGAILVVCKEDNKLLRKQLAGLNDEETNFAVQLERDFLKALMGGCSTPIGAHASIVNNQVVFQGNIVSPAGKEMMKVEKKSERSLAYDLGSIAAKELLEQGAGSIVEAIRQNNAK
jgi:hydroxymethylbilane synthase